MSFYFIILNVWYFPYILFLHLWVRWIDWVYLLVVSIIHVSHIFHKLHSLFFIIFFLLFRLNNLCSFLFNFVEFLIAAKICWLPQAHFQVLIIVLFNSKISICNNFGPFIDWYSLFGDTFSSYFPWFLEAGFSALDWDPVENAAQYSWLQLPSMEHLD